MHRRDIALKFFETIQDQIRHLRADLAHDRAADIKVVPARAAGAVAVEADGKGVLFAHVLPVHAHGCHPLAHGPGDIVHIRDAGIVVVIIMLHLRPEENVRNAEPPVLAAGEILRAALERRFENLSGDLQHRKRVRVRIRDEKIAAAHGLGQSRHIVCKARRRELRSARPELHRIEEIGERISLRRHTQRRVRRESVRQRTDHFIKPVLRAVLHLGKLLEPFAAARAVRGDGLARDALFFPGEHRFDADELLPAVGRLHDERAEKRLPRHGHVLVAGQQDIKIQFLTDAVGDIFVRGGEDAPRGKIALKAAVVDAERNVRNAFELFECRSRRRDRVGNADGGDMLRPLPDVHIVRHDADDTDTKAVFERVDARRVERRAAVFRAHIFAHAPRVQVPEIRAEIVRAEVEIVVAERHIVVAAAVHDPGKGAAVADRVVAEGAQRRALQQVAAVDDERIPVLFKAARAFEKADIPLVAAAVVRGVNVSVQVGSEVNSQLLICHSVLSPCKFRADLRGDPLNDEHEHDESEQYRAHLVPAVGAHRKDERRADAARADKTENGGVAQIHVKAVDDRGGEVRGELRQDAVADLLERGASGGVERFENALVEILDALDEHLRHHADRAERHREKPRERPGAGDADKHKAIHKRRDRADGGDHGAPDERDRLRHEIARRKERQRQRDDRADDRAEKRDAERLQQQIRHAVRAEREKELSRRVENAGEDVPRHGEAVAGGVAHAHGAARPREQARDDERRKELPDPRFRRGFVGFENFLVHSFPPQVRRLRSQWLSASMTMTVTKRTMRIMPRLSYSRQPIFSFIMRPRPPAPT